MFQAIDHDAHGQALREIHSQLTTVISATRTHRESGAQLADHQFVADLEDYTEQVADTVQRLQYICERLWEKSQSRSGYASAEYRSDVAEYDRSVEAYASLGKRPNVTFAIYRTDRDGR